MDSVKKYSTLKKAELMSIEGGMLRPLPVFYVGKKVIKGVVSALR